MELSQKEIYDLALETMSRPDRKAIHSAMTRIHHCTKESALSHIASWKEIKNAYSKNNTFEKGKIRDLESVIKMYEILERKGLTEAFIMSQWARVKQQRHTAVALYKGTPKKEHKDNKRVEGGALYLGACTTIARFPSKARGKKTWDNFWKLFPAFKGYYTLNEWRQAVYKKSKEESL